MLIRSERGFGRTLLGVVVALCAGRVYPQTPGYLLANADPFGCRACEAIQVDGLPPKTFRWPVRSLPEGTPSFGLRAPFPSSIDGGNSDPRRILLAQRQEPKPTPIPEQKAPAKQDKKEGDQQHSPSATSGSPKHIFWVIPAFKVDYGQGFKPLSAKEKFEEWAQANYDPLGLGTGFVEAGTLEYSSSDGFCGYGKRWSSYGECFGSLELDAADSSFIGDFLLPVWWHQDPRYFRLGEGSFGRRVWYAISRVFVTYNDSGHTVLYTSALTGTVVAAALSNLYYPPQDVGASHTGTRIAIDLGNTALYNLAAEFWPDIHRWLHF